MRTTRLLPPVTPTMFLLFGEMCSVANTEPTRQAWFANFASSAGMGPHRPFASPDAPVLLCVCYALDAKSCVRSGRGCWPP